MLFVMRFFNTSQDVMNRSTGKTDQYERARIAMDLLANDLQNLYYVEGFGDPVYFQNDTGSGDSKTTVNVSFLAIRPNKAGGATKTGLSWITYHFDSSDYTLKTGIAGDEKTNRDSKWRAGHLTGDDLGVLADGVYRFRITPYTAAGDEITPSTLASTSAGARWIPDYVRIELQLMDGETAASIKQIKKVSGGSLPKALDPSDDDFEGKDKVRTFYRIVEIDRGQY